MKKIIVLLCVLGLVLVPPTMSINSPINTVSSSRAESNWILLITEFGGNESVPGNVTEFDIEGNVMWQITDLSIPMDAERLENGNTLITLHGEEPGKVIEYTPAGEKLWIKSNLNLPTDAERLPNGHTLIAQYGNGKVTEVDEDSSVVWEVTGLHKPMDAERLPDGNTLIAEGEIWPYGKVLIVDSEGNEIWNITDLDGPVDVEKLSNGNILVTQHPKGHGGRVTEYDMDKNIIWEKTGLHHPQDAERLYNGNTLIVETDLIAPNRIIEINPDGEIIWKTDWELQYPVDVELLFNPSIPKNPSPKDGEINVPANPYLRVDVEDPDNDEMNVSFYNAFDNTLIGTDENVVSGKTASVQWNGLSFLTDYSWYVKANDGKHETISNTWNFTTVDYPTLPTIEITYPKEGFFYLQDKPIFSSKNRTIIYGPTTIKLKIVPTSIAQVEKVEIEINDKVEKTYGGDNDTINYPWSPTRCGQYNIKAIVYDREGQNTSDSITLFKWRFHPIILFAGFTFLLILLSQL